MYITILDYATGETIVQDIPFLSDNEQIEKYIEEKLGYKIDEISYMISNELKLHVLIDKERNV